MARYRSQRISGALIKEGGRLGVDLREIGFVERSA
jgi:hypothetical protein